MGANLAVLGTYQKSNPKNKVYYVNRLDFGFSVKKIGQDGKPIARTNLATGMPILNGRGEPEFFEENVMFKRWTQKFSESGYWCVYEVTQETSKIIAEELKRMAESKNHQVMTEKDFIKFSNPALSKHMEETADLEAERQMLNEDVAKAKAEKSKLEEEIARLKKKAGL